MAKITYRTPSGDWGIDGVDLSTLPPKVYAALHKLCDMEHPVCPTIGEYCRSRSDEELAALFCRHVDEASPLWQEVCKCNEMDGRCPVLRDGCCTDQTKLVCVVNWFGDPYLGEVSRNVAE